VAFDHIDTTEHGLDHDPEGFAASNQMGFHISAKAKRKENNNNNNNNNNN